MKFVLVHKWYVLFESVHPCEWCKGGEVERRTNIEFIAIERRKILDTGDKLRAHCSIKNQRKSILLTIRWANHMNDRIFFWLWIDFGTKPIYSSHPNAIIWWVERACNRLSFSSHQYIYGMEWNGYNIRFLYLYASNISFRKNIFPFS